MMRNFASWGHTLCEPEQACFLRAAIILSETSYGGYYLQWLELEPEGYGICVITFKGLFFDRSERSFEIDMTGMAVRQNISSKAVYSLRSSRLKSDYPQAPTNKGFRPVNLSANFAQGSHFQGI